MTESDLPPGVLPGGASRPKSPSGSSKAGAKALKRVEQAQRKREVAALLLARWTQTRIAEHLNVDPAVVCRTVKEIVADWREEHRADLHKARMHELSALAQDEARIRASLASLGADAHKARVAYQDVILKIMAARAKILGTDKPEKIEISGDTRVAFTSDVAKILADPVATTRLLDAVQGTEIAVPAVVAPATLNGNGNGVAH